MYAFDKFGLDFGWYNVLELAVVATSADARATQKASATSCNCCSQCSRWPNNSSLGYSIAKRLNSIRWNEMTSVARTTAFSIPFSSLSVSPFGFCACCMHTLIVS